MSSQRSKSIETGLVWLGERGGGTIDGALVVAHIDVEAVEVDWGACFG
jgi:hypothetical protein